LECREKNGDKKKGGACGEEEQCMHDVPGVCGGGRTFGEAKKGKVFGAKKTSVNRMERR